VSRHLPLPLKGKRGPELFVNQNEGGGKRGEKARKHVGPGLKKAFGRKGKGGGGVPAKKGDRAESSNYPPR